MSVLVLDVGTTTIRASLFADDAHILDSRMRPLPPSRPRTGVAEFDPVTTADVALELASLLLASHGPVDGVGIACQRASTVLFDAKSGEVLGPGLGWQDQRTAGQCLALRREDLRLSPNQSATKLNWLLTNLADGGAHELRFATIDTWIAWRLSEGGCFATDATNAAVTGLVNADATAWDETVCARLGIELEMLPEIVDSSGVIGVASALDGAPPISALVGDQQASLVGQGCLAAGSAKATFGTGGMLDCCLDSQPGFRTRGEAGTFPIVTRRIDGTNSYGIEGILLSAGTCVEWLRDSLGLVDSVQETDELAASVRDAGGVYFVPAFGGMGTPLWDFGARGTLVGLDAATSKAEVVHAVLDGIANAGADLLEACEQDGNLHIERLQLDGGMAANTTFVQLLADATGRPIARAALAECTSRGAGILAGVAVGVWPSLDSVVATLEPRDVLEPRRRPDRDRWRDARSRALRTVPFLSSLEF